jgi:hypothetical protein
MATPSAKDFPILSADLRAQLELVPLAHDRDFALAPCQVTLASGGVVDRVYVVEADGYFGLWGWDERRPYISLDDVVAIRESPTRLPSKYSDRVYQAGESGMGYVVFTVVTSNGSRYPFSMGDAVDFPNWPPNVEPRDVIDVLPHVGREAFRDGGYQPTQHGADYFWCLYSA